LLAPVALASLALAVWGLSDPTTTQQWLHGSFQRLWLYRHDGKGDGKESIADCVFDAQFAIENAMAFGLSITGAASSCPAIQEAEDKSKERMIDAAKSAHQARVTAIFGDKNKGKKNKGGMHTVAAAALHKVESVLGQYKVSGVPKHGKKHKSNLKATMEHTQDAVEAVTDSKELAKVAIVDRRICAADVSGVLSRLGYVTAAISHLTSECRLIFDQRAYCAGDISRLLAGITMMASSGAEIAASCTEYEKYIGADIAEFEGVRRLQAHGGVATLPVKMMIDSVEAMKTAQTAHQDKHLDIVDAMRTAHQNKVADEQARNVELTTCVTASWFAATFFARFLDMTPAVKHCTNGNNPHCAAAVIDIIASFSWTASSIAYAVAACPVKGQQQSAYCAAGITKIVAAIADTASALSVIAPTCLNKNATSPPSK